jgi:hypothetical protein
MMTRTTPRTTTLATMIGHTTMMITRRISDVWLCKFLYFPNRQIEIFANFVKTI